MNIAKLLFDLIIVLPICLFIFIASCEMLTDYLKRRKYKNCFRCSHLRLVAMSSRTGTKQYKCDFSDEHITIRKIDKKERYVRCFNFNDICEDIEV